MSSRILDNMFAGMMGQKPKDDDVDNVVQGVSTGVKVADKSSGDYQATDSRLLATQVAGKVSADVADESRGSVDVWVGQSATSSLQAFSQENARGAFQLGRPQVKHPLEFDFTDKEDIFAVAARYQEKLSVYLQEKQRNSAGAFTTRLHKKVVVNNPDSQAVKGFKESELYDDVKGAKPYYVDESKPFEIHVYNLQQDDSSAGKAVSNYARKSLYEQNRGRVHSLKVYGKNIQERIEKGEQKWGVEGNKKKNARLYRLLEDNEKNLLKAQKFYEDNLAKGIYELEDNTSPYDFTNRSNKLLEEVILPETVSFINDKFFYGVPNILFGYSSDLAIAFDEVKAKSLADDEALSYADEVSKTKLTSKVLNSLGNFVGKRKDNDGLLDDAIDYVQGKRLDNVLDKYSNNLLNQELEKKAMYSSMMESLNNEVALFQQEKEEDANKIAKALSYDEAKLKVEAQGLKSLEDRLPDVINKLGLDKEQVEMQVAKGGFLSVDKGQYLLTCRQKGWHGVLSDVLLDDDYSLNKNRLSYWQKEPLLEVKQRSLVRQLSFALELENSEDFLQVAKAKSFGKKVYRNVSKKEEKGKRKITKTAKKASVGDG